MAKIFLLIFLFFTSAVYPCTAFQLKGKDGSIIYARSLEFGFRMNSDMLIVPRDIEYQGTALKGKGLKWKVKHGYVGMNQFFENTFISDGMNEKGLIASILYMPGYAKYQQSDLNKKDKTLGSWELISFLLATCSTIEEVKSALSEVIVSDEPLPGTDFILPVHFYISDALGKTIIVEYIEGMRHEYENPLGVLTNSPTFDWHLKNLTNFITLSPKNVSELRLPNWTIKGLGQGNGLLGLPGDYTPPSRFVKATFFSQWAKTPKNALEGVNLAFHILNTFDIFEGIVKNDPSSSVQTPFGEEKEEITEWTIVHDRTNLKTYFRTYESLEIQTIDLKKLDFTRKVLGKIALNKTFKVRDISENWQTLQKATIQ